jgi:hypothetical protein
MTDFTRRKAIAVAVGTLAGAAASPRLSAPAAAADLTDVDLFVQISAELTGIDAVKLAPDADSKKVDPFKIKLSYFDQAKKDPAFVDLMNVVRAAPNFATAATDIMTNSSDDIKFLGRSIILAWYLGTWYRPTVLQLTQPPSGVLPDKVISAAAYTQGWTWRVAQAHPMGYSELRFGHWSDKPLSFKDFTGKDL